MKSKNKSHENRIIITELSLSSLKSMFWRPVCNDPAKHTSGTMQAQAVGLKGI
jgi:hypothetical protein